MNCTFGGKRLLCRIIKPIEKSRLTESTWLKIKNYGSVGHVGSPQRHNCSKAHSRPNLFVFVLLFALCGLWTTCFRKIDMGRCQNFNFNLFYNSYNNYLRWFAPPPRPLYPTPLYYKGVEYRGRGGGVQSL